MAASDQFIDTLPERGYDEVLAPAYDAWLPPGTVFADDRVHLGVIRRAGGTALELGTGNGRFLVPARQQGLDVEGLESSPHMLARCRAHLAAAGLDALSSMLRSLATRFPGWSLFALEQERLPDSARASTPRDLWLYAQSNVLIHHLIGNGQILPRDRWLEVYRAAGCTVRAVVELGYLGYHAHVVQLG